MLEKEIKHIAHHEAAHHVAGFILLPDDVRDVVTIKPGDGYLGSADCESPSRHVGPDGRAPGREVIEPYIISLFAGYEAEATLNPEIKEIADTGAWDDLEKAEDYARWIWPTEDEQKRGLAELQQETKAFVKENWTLIEVLAKELIDREMLQADEADYIIDIGN